MPRDQFSNARSAFRNVSIANMAGGVGARKRVKSPPTHLTGLVLDRRGTQPTTDIYFTGHSDHRKCIIRNFNWKR
jgi:hypothetical protein